MNLTNIGIATILVAILGIIAISLTITALYVAFDPFESEPVVIQQPAIQTGQQATIECIGGEVRIDGVNRSKWVTINWESPVINQPDMVKTLYCLNGSIRTE